MLKKYKIAVLLIFVGLTLPALAMYEGDFAANLARAMGGQPRSAAQRRKAQAGKKKQQAQENKQEEQDDQGQAARKSQTLAGALKNALDWAKTPEGGMRGIFDLNGQVVETNDPFEYMTSPEGRAEIKKSFANKRAKAIAEGKDPNSCKINVPCGDGIAVAMNEQDFGNYLDYIARLNAEAKEREKLRERAIAELRAQRAADQAELEKERARQEVIRVLKAQRQAAPAAPQVEIRVSPDLSGGESGDWEREELHIGPDGCVARILFPKYKG